MNLKELKEILQILDEQEITEFELEEEGMKLRVRRPGAPHPRAPRRSSDRDRAARRRARPPPFRPPRRRLPPRPAPAAPGRRPLRRPPPRRKPEAGLTVVKSPIVGTFYRSPDPNSPPFVSVGDRVKVGQVLCIIEAMKLMNEIEAEVAGEIVKVHHENGQPVQYGEPLFTLRP